NPNGTNFVQQRQLTGPSAGNLNLAWSFPFPAASPPKGLNLTGQGEIAPPLIVNGIVYGIMNDLHILAIRASDGAVLWTYQPIINRSGLPLGLLAGHVHGLNYHDGWVWASLPDCSALALNALTGAPTERISRICADIPGNSGRYDYSGAPIVFDGNIMFWTASSVSEGTDAGRGFVAAYNVSNGRLLWRWYVSPPSGGDPQWDLQSCLPPCHGNVLPFIGDWGTLGTVAGVSRAGAGPSWGQPAVDFADGLIVLGTSQPSPDWNATYRPGPDLYSDSVVALNITTGSLYWFYQTTPHDLYDFDCGWNVAIGSAIRNGVNVTAVFKTCKNGYTFALDAKSGYPLWEFNPPTIRRTNTGNADYTVTGKYNATEPWTPSVNGTVKQCPGINGAYESDISVAYGQVYVATHNFCTVITQGPVGRFGGSVSGGKNFVFDFLNANTTIYAIDASTGAETWSFSIPSIPYRGWLTSTGTLVFASTLDGRILALDARTGALIGSTTVGSSLYEGVTVGNDAAGNVLVLQLTSSPSYGGFVTGVPGSLLAFRPARPISNVLGLLPYALATVVAAGVVITYLLTKLLKSQREAGSGTSPVT
ncbi:MAG: PQQ-binding-like beta-propeller repeat protein, partial [Thaumarchaeota archaeon]|nr:PQQ-binding-like beta-propeller repeat protein [Nitrososphaerota archaeon]